jgi:hypothetical protein
VIEERRDVLIELFSRRREAEGHAFEKFQLQIALELSDLRADRGLLNAVGNVPHCGADPSVFRDVIKKLEEVNIHESGGGASSTLTIEGYQKNQ